MRFGFLAVSIFVAACLVFMFAYLPLTEAVVLPDALSARQANVQEDVLLEVLSQSELRGAHRPKDFSFAPRILSHAIEQ